MAKMSASPHGRHAPHGSQPGTPRDPRALDPDMLELVEKFEQNYAQLAPAAEEPQGGGASSELFPEFPDVFEDPAPARPAAPESARVLTMPRRDHEPAAAHATAFTAAPQPRHGAVADVADVDLDEAMAILRAAENRTGPAPAPGVDEEEIAAVSTARPTFDSRPDASDAARTDVGRQVHAPGAAPATDWTTRSHRTHTIAAAAAVAALMVGLAAGYLLGNSPAAAPQKSPLETSQTGGAQLKLDRELSQR